MKDIITMLGFIITVKSKKITEDWSNYTKLVERTIKSTCNQTNLNFETIVVCHEIPEIHFQNPKVHFVQANWEAPSTQKDKSMQYHRAEIDKGRKLRKGVEYAKSLDVTYVMTVDSDDCVSNKLAEFIHENGSGNSVGWYVKKGFLYREGSRFTFLNLKNFNWLCGSCIIIKPELIEMMFNYEPYLIFRHQRIQLSNGEKLLPLPFPGAIYSVANGQNIFMSISQVREMNYSKNHLTTFVIIKRLINKIVKYRPRILGSRFKKEFQIYPIR